MQTRLDFEYRYDIAIHLPAKYRQDHIAHFIIKVCRQYVFQKHGQDYWPILLPCFVVRCVDMHTEISFCEISSSQGQLTILTTRIVTITDRSQPIKYNLHCNIKL